MATEIPQNEVRTIAYEVSASTLALLTEKMHDLDDVLKVESERMGYNFKVTIHFALMNLNTYFRDLTVLIEETAKEASGVSPIRS